MRRIIHIDMDAFYASVEQRDRPELRGRPVAVGGSPDRRGVVAASSYEARAFGVRSAMSMARAVQLCPPLAVVPPNFTTYKEVSGQVFALFREVTPLVEPLSLDEAYLDVTENAWGEPLAVTIAKRLKAEIRARTGLTASAGVAPNKFLAKIASGWQKPDGLTVIPPERVEAFLQKLPIDALWGVGPVTARKLRGIGLERLIDVRDADPERLKQAVGRWAEWLVQLSHGHDNRPVEPHRERKSIGTENTFDNDLTDSAQMAEAVATMAREDAAYLEQKGLFARTVTIKVRYGDFTTVTRSDTREPASRDSEAMAARAVALLARTDAASRPVRLLGVSLHGLVDHPMEAPEPRPGTTRPLPFDE